MKRNAPAAEATVLFRADATVINKYPPWFIADGKATAKGRAVASAAGRRKAYALLQ